MELKQVEGYKDLVRDVKSTAIINTNLSAYEAAIKRHKEAEERKVLLNEYVNELKELVKILLTKGTEDGR